MGDARAELDEEAADRILAVQLTIAWAGEAAEPPRLNWWKTDLVDPAGGGDLLARLLPRTYRWAGFELAREAARRTDRRARNQMAASGRTLTLFHLGFHYDEQLDERIRIHKNAGIDPFEILPSQFFASGFHAAKFVDWIGTLEGEGGHQVGPGGRKLTAPLPSDRYTLVANLATALLPLAETYPVPFLLES